MAEKRWLTKEQKLLLKPHAAHYQEMYSHISELFSDGLAELADACRACTQVNCSWNEYAAAQYLLEEIDRETLTRSRRAAELVGDDQ